MLGFDGMFFEPSHEEFGDDGTDWRCHGRPSNCMEMVLLNIYPEDYDLATFKAALFDIWKDQKPIPKWIFCP